MKEEVKMEVSPVKEKKTKKKKDKDMIPPMEVPLPPTPMMAAAALIKMEDDPATREVR